jgi:hypothetical protein
VPGRFWRRPKPRVALFVMNLDDMHRVHPQQDDTRVCSRCGWRVGIYPSGQAIITTIGAENVDLICNRCGSPAGAIILAPGALDEPDQSRNVMS